MTCTDITIGINPVKQIVIPVPLQVVVTLDVGF